jgi:hypothetical protein
MTDILDQIDGVIAEVTACACGCGKSISDKGPSGDFYGEMCQARWMARMVGARAECPWPSCPACGRRMDVVGRYCEPCAIALSGPVTGDFGPVHPPVAARPSFTLADMEAASAAVRARRDPAPFTQAEINDWNRHQMLSLECGMHNPLCSGCDGGAIDGFSCLHVCHPLATDPRRQLAAETHARRDAPPVDAALEPHDCPVERVLGVRCPVCEPQPDDRPWWRRMLGGTR